MHAERERRLTNYDLRSLPAISEEDGGGLGQRPTLGSELATTQAMDNALERNVSTSVLSPARADDLKVERSYPDSWR